MGVTRQADLIVSNNGVLGITARVARMLSLEPGDVVDLAVDGVECYLYVRHRHGEIHGRHEGAAKPTSKCKKVCRNMRVHSVRLCRMLLRLCHRTDKARLMVGEKEHLGALGVDGVPIVTRISL